VGRVAELAGTAARHAVVVGRPVVRSIPGAAGALLVSYGAWQAWPPAGFIVAGAFLLAERWIP
jgi:hypothetical protein